MLKLFFTVMCLATLSSLSYGQSYFGTGTTTPNPGRGTQPMTAQQYKDAVDRMSRQYDNTINQQVKQIMPKQAPPSTGLSGPNMQAVPMPSGPMPPPVMQQQQQQQPPPPTSISNQPSSYPAMGNFNNPTNNVAPTTNGQVYPGFQGAAPSTMPANTNKPSSGWGIKY